MSAPEAGAQGWRGRVIARSPEGLRVRTELGDRLLPATGAWAGVAPGDLIEGQGDVLVRRVFASVAEDYPGPQHEVTRLGHARVAGLQARARVLRGVREFFHARDFLEIEPPTLVPAPGLEIEIRAVAAGDGYLITSPEFAMKRLLVGGLERIYALARCFRAGEVGSRHQSEFTMLEWYRGFDTLEAIRTDTEELVAQVIAEVAGEATAVVNGRTIDLTPPWDRLTVAEAFERWVGVSLVGSETEHELADKLRAVGVDVGTATEWHDLFYCAFLERIEPELECWPRALFVEDWPTPLAALAQRKPGTAQVAERFEAYVGGVELANAFGELTDAREQRARFLYEQKARARKGLEVYPLDEKFLAALDEGMPPSAGIALGVDRLAMLAARAEDIRLVCAFASDEL